LEVKAEPLAPCQVQLTVVADPAQVERALTEAAQAYARHMRIPGYRPGKVPARAVVARVGEEALHDKAAERLRERVVREAISSEGIEPSAPATVEQLTEDPPTFRVVVPLAPEVDLGDYRALRLAPTDARAVADEEVEAVIERWRADLGFLAPVDRPAEAGDIVSLGLVGWDGDVVVFEDDALTLKLDAASAVEANLPPAVAEALVGRVAGETAQFEVTYSELWTQPELQGRTVRFEADLASVLTPSLPEIDDDLAREVSRGELETIEGLRGRVRQEMTRRAEIRAREAHVEAVIDALVAPATVRYAPALVDVETAEIVGDLRSRVERQGFTWDRWLELQGKDIDSLWAELAETAELRLRRRLVLAEFVRAEGIAVAAPEIEAELERMEALLTGVSRRAMPSRDTLHQSIGTRLLSDRAVARLLAIAAGDGPAPAAAPDTREDDPEERP